MTQVLIIGYGNTLRSDDGAGQRVAEAIQQWDLPGVRSLPVHQLTPDLAADLADVDRVIFVDAVSFDPASTMEISLHPLTTIDSSSPLGHACDPRSLLALTQRLYDKTPAAYGLWIPAETFAFGEMLSSVTQTGIEIALAKIKEMLCITLTA